MKYSAIWAIFLFLFFSCTNTEYGADYEKRLNRAEQQVDKIMEMMDLPEYGLVKMSKEGLYTSQDFNQAGTDMIKHGRDMKDVDYPDKKFMAMTEEMLTAFDSFEAALKSKEKSIIENAWKVVYKTCKDCHDVYD